MEQARGPLRVSIVNDYEVVVAGLAGMLAPYADRVRVVELDANAMVRAEVDIALYDTFAQAHGDRIDAERIVADLGAEKVVAYTWDADARDHAGSDRGDADHGVAAYLTKRMPGDELVAALEQIHAGTWEGTGTAAEDGEPLGEWPGKAHGLSERESEVVALIVQGLSNQQVADRAYLSINTVKSHIRTAYRKMGAGTRSQAILWALDHGFERGRVRIRPDGDAL